MHHHKKDYLPEEFTQRFNALRKLYHQDPVVIYSNESEVYMCQFLYTFNITHLPEIFIVNKGLLRCMWKDDNHKIMLTFLNNGNVETRLWDEDISLCIIISSFSKVMNLIYEHNLDSLIYKD